MTAVEESSEFHIEFVTREGFSQTGPLSLLWELIEKYKVDIFEVKLSVITDDFIAYMNENFLSLDDQSEFTVMAARLLYYKSKLLLPNPGFEEEEEEDHLPFELVEQLLEYKKFQQAAEFLRNFEDSMQKTMTREPTWSDYLPEESYLQVDLMSFLLVFKDFLEKQEKKQPIEVAGDEIVLEDIIESLRKALATQTTVSFFKYIVAFSVLKCVMTFMAVLELVKIQEIVVYQKKAFEDIFIERKTTQSITEPSSIANDTDKAE